MKKFFWVVFFIMFLLGSAYGASSDDVYLRKDVFDAKMDAFMSEIRLMNMDLRREMDKRFNALDKKIDDVKIELHQEIQNVKAELQQEIQSVKTELHQEIQNVKAELQQEIQKLSSKIDVLEERFTERVEGLKTAVYWLLALTAIFVASGLIPSLSEYLKGLLKQKPSITPEDIEILVKRLIDSRLEAKQL